MSRKTNAEKEKERTDNMYLQFCEEYNQYQSKLLRAIITGLLLQKQLAFTHLQGNIIINAFDNPRRLEFDVNGVSLAVSETLPRAAVAGEDYNNEFARYCSYVGTIHNLNSIITEIEALQHEQQKMVAKEKLRESALAKLSREEREALGVPL